MYSIGAIRRKNMNHEINRLLHFALEKELIQKEDIAYCANLLIDVLQEDEFVLEKPVHEGLYECTSILENILNLAVKKGLLEDTITARDLFDTRIMNCIMPRPSEVIKTFEHKYQESPIQATNYYYQLSIASNYIRKSRTDKNIRWKHFYKYGNIEISINLSKPEKDPKEIAKAKTVKNSSYPKCLLCKENVGFAGDLNRPARQNHRIIPLLLDDTKYYLQYSPYVYYNEHCIVLNEEHVPMVINHKTFVHLLAFLDIFPHYTIGSNADLPIVGGSILTHDHYQGGKYAFPIEGAKVLKTITLPDFPKVTIEVMRWPLSTIRATSLDKNELVAFADTVLAYWKEYSAPSLDIINCTQDTPHNTITPIARRKQEAYQLDLVLRNNRTDERYPDGIFHPHTPSHHIKKENIGLIEVMGLAILPARLKTELASLKECLLGVANIEEYPELDKHMDWYKQLLQDYEITKENIDEIIKEAVTIKFVTVLEDAGVFKMNETGIDAFISFVEAIKRRKV